jgi:hypothetical protein
MYTGKPLFADYGKVDEFIEAIVKKQARPAIPEEVAKVRVPSIAHARARMCNADRSAESLVQLLERCWARESRNRRTFNQIVFDLDCIISDVVALSSKMQIPSHATLASEFWKRHFVFPRRSLQERVKFRKLARRILSNVEVRASFELALLTQSAITARTVWSLCFERCARISTLSGMCITSHWRALCCLLVGYSQDATKAN